ncbi:MAG: CBS domain-containing protein [Nitrososphaeraceae archaeon]|nr:CBS domain-containing protein [Nitrososphaeraceae archaeon]MDW3626570.1 CBS domain-containing protein [Nitrososphaeraceae archaeon]MDW3631150.1 CBS domain-containing protein [Nitrososphaeraceae archaeon]
MSKKNVVSIQSNSEITALDISKLMVKNKVGSVLVLDSANLPIGIITERDIIKKVCVTNTLPNEMKADKIMSSPVITIMSYDSIETAAQKMTNYKIKRLPVLEENQQIASILSLTDITKHLSKILVDDYKRFRFLKSIFESD